MAAHDRDNQPFFSAYLHVVGNLPSRRLAISIFLVVLRARTLNARFQAIL